jgi:hypothetical protein
VNSRHRRDRIGHDPVGVVGGRARPRVACPTCGLRIPLDSVVAVGVRRVLICNRCHTNEVWEISGDRSNLRSLDLSR